MCICEEKWIIKHTIYHNENFEPTLSLVKIVYCNHMGSSEQILIDIPLGITAKEWKIKAKRIEILKSIPNIKLDDKAIKSLARNGYYLIRSYSCPYCTTR